MVIAAAGTVDDILVSGADDDVHACVSKFVKRAHFARARSKTAVQYPLILR